MRKLENERIERENHAFAKRLFDKTGSISKKRLDYDWINQVKYRKNIEKVKPKKMPKLDGRHGKMPPLDGMNDSTFDDRKRSQGSIQAKAPVVGVDPNAPKKESVNLKKVNTDQEASPAREKAEEE